MQRLDYYSQDCATAQYSDLSEVYVGGVVAIIEYARIGGQPFNPNRLSAGYLLDRAHRVSSKLEGHTYFRVYTSKRLAIGTGPSKHIPGN